jgi:uncharacterized protein with von Willebrand factor type A (vWA) domain
MELAKRMNTPKFRKVAEIFGPMDSLAIMEQKRRVDYLREEIYDIELGDDLRRILPYRLAQMSDPEEEDLFWADFVEGRLMQYQMRGTERVAKGGIIYLHDGSGSMKGDKEVWAKAVGLCLLHIARKQKRSMWAIQFGASHQVRVDDFHDSSNIVPEAVIDFAEYFFNGGTSFVDPLNKALAILKDEHAKTGFTKSDIVFATDGLAHVTPEWLKPFKEDQEKLDFRVWGINIGGSKTAEPFYSICDGRVAAVQDLQSGADLREIFGGL